MDCGLAELFGANILPRHFIPRWRYEKANQNLESNQIERLAVPSFRDSRFRMIDGVWEAENSQS
jgi:hypothetical protein